MSVSVLVLVMELFVWRCKVHVSAAQKASQEGPLHTGLTAGKLLGHADTLETSYGCC